MEEFEMEFVSSSHLEAVGYREDIKTLRFHFKVVSLYEYYNFPLVEYESFRNSHSLGSYLNYQIKNKYPYNKIG